MLRWFGFFNRLYDISSGSEVPGRYIKDTIELSWRAQDPIRVARHEAMHYAYDHLLLAHERWVLDDAFAPGTELNKRTQDLLIGRGLHDAARESRDSAQECAAYAFEYWARGELEVTKEPQGVFQKVVSTLSEIGSWVRRLVNPKEQQSAEDVLWRFTQVFWRSASAWSKKCRSCSDASKQRWADHANAPISGAS